MNDSAFSAGVLSLATTQAKRRRRVWCSWTSLLPRLSDVVPVAACPETAPTDMHCEFRTQTDFFAILVLFSPTKRLHAYLTPVLIRAPQPQQWPMAMHFSVPPAPAPAL
ncbi:hypothetical protein PENSPDRAFT_647426 [Peniophora sp. CONT]|nr:hypothetical protein PENSPDRAFT_647426 [Peniophora sp. CONT]